MATEHTVLCDWHNLSELLITSQYEQVAEFLAKAQLSSKQTDDLVLINILTAAHLICLACSQCRNEAAWLNQACETAEKREAKLKDELYDILNLLNSSGTPATRAQQVPSPLISTVELTLPGGDILESGKQPGFLQRIQNLLGWGITPQLAKQELPEISVEALAASSIVKAEVTAPPPADEAEVSTAPSIEEEKEDRDLASLVVYCLGPFRIYQNDRLIVEWSSLKGQSILKYLVMHKGGPVAKDILIDVFWPDAEPGDARRNLHQAIYSLRQTLRRGELDLQPIQFKKDCYLLNPEMAIWLDFEEFEKHVQTGRRLETAGQLAEAVVEYSIAEGLYQGNFLEEDLYEDWPSLQREHLRSLYLNIADCLSEYYAQQGEYTAAITLCQKILAKDNCYEEAYCRLMRCYLAQGQRHLAVRQYQTCVQTLKQELDLTPSEETVELYQRIASG